MPDLAGSGPTLSKCIFVQNSVSNGTRITKNPCTKIEAYFYLRRKLKMGRCREMVRSESFCRSSNCFIFSRWFRGRANEKSWTSHFPQSIYFSPSLYTHIYVHDGTFSESFSLLNVSLNVFADEKLLLKAR